MTKTRSAKGCEMKSVALPLMESDAVLIKFVLCLASPSGFDTSIPSALERASTVPTITRNRVHQTTPQGSREVAHEKNIDTECTCGVSAKVKT